MLYYKPRYNSGSIYQFYFNHFYLGPYLDSDESLINKIIFSLFIVMGEYIMVMMSQCSDPVLLLPHPRPIHVSWFWVDLFIDRLVSIHVRHDQTVTWCLQCGVINTPIYMLWWCHHVSGLGCTIAKVRMFRSQNVNQASWQGQWFSISQIKDEEAFMLIQINWMTFIW